MSLFESNSILFQLLNEADDDDILNGSLEDDSAGKNYGSDNADDNADNQNNDNNQNNDADQNNNEDQGGNDEDNDSDDDFNIDLDDAAGDDNKDTSGGSTDLDSGSSSTGATEGEVNKANTDIFDTLTGEEQAIKISELKNLFNTLYITINETITKLRSVDNDNIKYEIIYRLSSTLYDLREDVSTYIFKVFPTKSYYENDVAYNRFLAILNGISSVLGDISTKILGKSS